MTSPAHSLWLFKGWRIIESTPGPLPVYLSQPPKRLKRGHRDREPVRLSHLLSPELIIVYYISVNISIHILTNISVNILCILCIDANRQTGYNIAILGGEAIKKVAPHEGRNHMAVSKAQQKAVTKYVKNRYDRFGLTMQKGKLDEIKSAAAAAGESVNAYINGAIDDRMCGNAPRRPQEPFQGRG